MGMIDTVEATLNPGSRVRNPSGSDGVKNRDGESDNGSSLEFLIQKIHSLKVFIFNAPRNRNRSILSELSLLNQSISYI